MREKLAELEAGAVEAIVDPMHAAVDDGLDRRERRLVTILFADIVGSTTIGESMDPEEVAELVARRWCL